MSIDLRTKKILVTGGVGFLGSHLIENLIKNRGVPEENIFAPRFNDFDLRLFADCIKAVNGRDVVIHAAGITGNTEFHRQNPAKIFYDNLIMGVHLMEAARQAGVKKFITIGSATEYPDNVSIPFKEENLWAGPVEASHLPYTMAKKMLQVMALAYRQQYGFNALHLIMTNMYGPGDKLERGFAIPMLIKKVLDAKQKNEDFIDVWGTGRATRDFLYIEDAAEGIILATEKYDKSEPVNFGSGWEISIKELAELICRLLDFKGKIRFDPSKPDGQARRLLDTTRAEKEFSFKALTDFETGLKKTIKWLSLI